MILLLHAQANYIPLPDQSVHMVVTSPPYWSLRDYGIPDQIGLEPTPEEYVARIVEAFREVKRVLRNDGTCWINLGDSYSTGADNQNMGGAVGARTKDFHALGTEESGWAKHRKVPSGLKPKDLVGIPWRVAFALQADGWYLRSDIIWSKPNPMPESVTDRPTKSHEYLFLLAKQERYYYDQEAVREGEQIYFRKAGGYKNHHEQMINEYSPFKGKGGFADSDITTIGRNRRSVWTIATQPTPEAHFATYPQALVEPCIKAGTSEHGCCPKCGKQWERMVKHTRIRRDEFPINDPRYRPSKYNGAYEFINGKGDAGYANNKTLGFHPSCSCGLDPVPCIILDPFIGSGTTAIVARRLGRSCVGLDLSYTYLHDIARKRLGMIALEEWTQGKQDTSSLEDLPLFQGGNNGR